MAAKKKTSRASSKKASSRKTKYEVANEIGVDTKQGYNGGATSRQTSTTGSQMTKRAGAKGKQKSSR